MADQIKHGSTEIVSSSAQIADGALPSVGANKSVSGSTTTIPNLTVDLQGRVTAASTTAVKMTGVDFVASGNTLVDQTIFVNASAPSSSDGANGDVWYQTIS
jgi:hypothetical protein